MQYSPGGTTERAYTGKLSDGNSFETAGAVMKQTAELVGFEVVGRIALRDKATGKEYR